MLGTIGAQIQCGESEDHMLRITETTEGDHAVRVRLDGIVSITNFAELEKICACYQARPDTMILLDMAGVTFMSSEAASQFVRLRSNNVSIVNCSPFIDTLLDLATASRNGTP